MINWGMIGCGNVTEKKSGPAFSKVPGSRLLGVTRRNFELAEDYAHRHNVPRVYRDASELISDKDINAVYIATPPGSHAMYATEAIRAGKPVYIEKPMALNYDECRLINETAEKHRVPVFVAYYRRTLPGFVRVKEFIDEGKIGKVLFAGIELFKPPSDDEKAGRLPWRVDPAESGGGHFFDLASHQLDYLDFLFGPVTKVSSVALNHGGLYQAEDFVTASFTFGNGVVATGTWSFAVPPSMRRDRIEIVGDKGSLSFSTFTFEPIILNTEGATLEFENEQPEHVQYFLIGKIVSALEGKGSSPSTGISAARTSQVMDEVVRHYYASGKRI